MALPLGADKAVTAVRDNIPAILWLTIALLALWTLRHGRLPTPGEAATGGAAVAVVGLAGSVVPRLAVWVLLALLVAAAIGGAPAISSFIQGFSRSGVTLSLNPGGSTGG